MPTLKLLTQRHLRRRERRDNPVTICPKQTTVESAARQTAEFARYRFDPILYLREKMGWEPWRGTEEQPGQVEVIDAYVLALRQMHEREEYEAGTKTLEELTVWQPGVVIQNWLRIEAGHAVGKTKLFSGLVNHFFDCFVPSILYTFAPTFEQIHDLLWKEVKADRRGKGLPGRILDLALVVSDNHFAKGRATNNAGGRGSERAQGQHGKYLLFAMDEAEGIPDFVYNAVKSMMSGGICICLMAANPRTRSSTFYRQRELPVVKNFRISCLSHPNVIAGRAIIPEAVKRDYVLDMIETNAEPVAEENPDTHTFTLPFPASKRGQVYPAGQVWEPDAEFMFRVLGVAPANSAHNTLCPIGRYEAACQRKEKRVGSDIRMGIDVSRWGDDFGTLYVRVGNWVWRAARFAKQDTTAYVGAIKTEALRLQADGARSLHIRVDGGGGFGGGVIDQLKHDPQLKAAFGAEFKVFEVDFGGKAYDEKAYHYLMTQLYAEAAETLKGLCLLNAPKELEADLCERQYKWVNVAGIAVKQLEPKEAFRQRLQRSPDDGDGFVLAVAPDFLFKRRTWEFS
jgi:hypothetical protein